MHRRLRFFALASVLTGSLACLRAQSPENTDWPLPETYFPGLKTLLDSAVRQSPRMIARNAEEAVAEGNRIIAKAGQLPSLGGYFRYFPWDRDERVADPNSPYTSQKTSYALNLTQPVYHWGALESTARIGELQRKIARGDTAESYRALASEIRGQFLQLIIKKAGLARTRFAQRLAEDDLKLAKEKSASRVISEADLFSPTLAVEQAQLATDRTEDDYESAKKFLAKLAGAAPLADAQIPDAIPDVAQPQGRFEGLLAEFATQTEAGSYVLKNVRDQIEIEKLNYRIAAARLRPNVDVLIGSSQDEQSYTANIGAKYGVTSYFTGVQVNWSIFDGFASKGAKLNSLTRRRELERRYQQMSADLLEQAQAKLRQLQFATRSLEIGRKQLANSDRNLASAKDNTARGLASESDLRMAEFGYAGALIDTYNARADYLARVADFLGTVLKDPALSNLPGPSP